MYQCTDCNQTFQFFAQANNHELDTDYRHLTVQTDYQTPTEEFALCACGCGEVMHAVEAVWDGEDPYCSLSHLAHMVEV